MCTHRYVERLKRVRGAQLRKVNSKTAWKEKRTRRGRWQWELRVISLVKSFLFAKPNRFHKTQTKVQSLGACWVCRYNLTTGAVCGQCTGWEAPRRSGELHSSILIARGAQRGQKTVGRGRCVQRYSAGGGSLEDNTDYQQLSRL